MNDNDHVGIFRQMSNDEHHRRQAIGSSGLKLMKDRTPLHYWAAYLDPGREKKEPTPAMKLGTAWHKAIFEPEAFAATYMAKPDINGQTKKAKLLNACLDDPAYLPKLVSVPDGLNARNKEGKALIAGIEADGGVAVEESDFAWICDWHEKLRGKEVLSADDMRRVQEMAAAARQHPIGRVLFSPDLPSICEASIFTRDPQTGVLCKIRPDYMVEPCQALPNGLLVDGKSCEDASPAGFARAVWNYDYGLQAAWYVDHFWQHYRTAEPPGFIWMAQEKDPPQATAFYSASADILNHGRQHYRRLLDIYAECLKAGVWPGYPPQVRPLELPVWAQKQMQEAA